MKTVKKNVYYCDFCKKRGLSASSMSKHEKHCTANPNRICRLCENSLNIGEIVTELKKRFVIKQVTLSGSQYFEGEMDIEVVEWIGEPITFGEVENIAENCPNCMLAIIRQTGLSQHPFDNEIGINQFNFKYKEYSSSYFADKQRDNYNDGYM
ncbi:MAG: hypothetical protein WC998_05550 [Candidatus Paceibacterota bacterium]|jgi:hypothetical protein